MGMTLVTPPTDWPVTLEAAKTQCRVLHDDEDTYIEGLIRAATKYVEQNLSRSIAVQQWKLSLDAFTDAIELLRGPVKSVESVQYVDVDGITQTVDDDDYAVDLSNDRRWWVVRNSATAWPSTMNAINVVAITYTAGYDEAPDDIRHAILLLIGHWYSAREAAAEKPAQAIELAVDALLQPFRWVLV